MTLLRRRLRVAGRNAKSFSARNSSKDVLGSPPDASHFLSAWLLSLPFSPLNTAPRRRWLPLHSHTFYPRSLSRLTRECRSARTPAGRRPVPRDCRIGCLRTQRCQKVENLLQLRLAAAHMIATSRQSRTWFYELHLLASLSIRCCHSAVPRPPVRCCRLCAAAPTWPRARVSNVLLHARPLSPLSLALHLILALLTCGRLDGHFVVYPLAAISPFAIVHGEIRGTKNRK